jgi:hypothetical protein
MLLASNMPLPGLPCADQAKTDLSVLLCPPGAPDDSDIDWFHEWKTHNGKISIMGGRRDSGYLLRFPGLADFHIRPELDEIQIIPESGSESATLAHLLLDQVIPRLLNQQGHLVVHASAVMLPQGRAVAFLGNTGSGKSTLASSFYRSGCRVLADDSLLLSFQSGEVNAIPAYPSLRLWPDSAKELFSDDTDFQPVAHYSEKKQLLTLSELESHAPVPLHALCLLDMLAEEEDSASVRIQPAKRAEDTMAIIESMFVLDLEQAETVAQNFRLAAKLVSGALPVFRLAYRRSYEQLPLVRRELEQTIGNMVEHVR